ncbi:MAG TPA: M50 family metallopeptidase [Candidatus Limnocylindria bacterium]|nr:M50 family metallopeptidase [Candidatus Limnocylindria bacterium]
MEGLIFGLTAFILFILVLGSLVLIHELGHYLTARLFNVRVLEFGIGFPPRAKVLRSKGETLWTLNWLPIGGFVRLDGEDGDAADDPRSFSAQPLRVRLAILVAGVAMNIVLAFAIFFLIALVASPRVGISTGEVEAGSPAAAAGLQAGDAILGVNEERFEWFGERDVTDALRGRAGETVALLVKRADGRTETVNATLRPAAQLSENVGALGIRDLELVVADGYVGHDIGRSAQIATGELTRWGGLILGGLGKLIGDFAADPTARPQASGPIGIAVSLAEIFTSSGLVMTLYVAGILSVNLGVVNILPFPPLDGGRGAVLIIKRLFGSRVSLRAERMTYAIGMVVLLAFIIWISGFDIANIGNPPP